MRDVSHDGGRQAVLREHGDAAWGQGKRGDGGVREGFSDGRKERLRISFL